MLARIGGEEFAIILPSTNQTTATSIAQDIRTAVRALEIPHSGGRDEFVTVSIGGATWAPHQEVNPQQLFDDADMALFRAKAAGRNQVIFVGEE